MAVGAHALTTVARFRAFLAGKLTFDSTAGETTALEMLIDQASERIERACDRHFEQATYANELYSPTGRLLLVLRQWPVTAVTKVEDSMDGGRTWETIAAADYQIDAQAIGILRYDGWPDSRILRGLSLSPDGTMGDYGARVSYTAGYSLPQGGGSWTLPADLEGACLEWVADAWMHRDVIGLASRSESATETSVGTVFQDIPPRVARVIATYKRMRV